VENKKEKSILDELNDVVKGETFEEMYGDVVEYITSDAEKMAVILQGVSVDMLNALLDYRKEIGARNVRNIEKPKGK